MDISYSTKRILPISSPKLVNETRHQHGGLRVAKYDKRVCKKEKEGELIAYIAYVRQSQQILLIRHTVRALIKKTIFPEEKDCKRRK